MAFIYPPFFGKENPSPGEKLVFEKFKDGDSFSDWSIFHSYYVKEHHSKKWGEIDYLCIIPNYGVVCLEVKAHKKIVVKDREWFFSGKKDESPFKQCADASEDFKKQISKDLPWVKNIPWFHGVIFTHATLPNNIDPREFELWQFIGPTQASNKDFLKSKIEAISTRGLERQNQHPKRNISTEFNHKKLRKFLNQNFSFFPNRDLEKQYLIELEKKQISLLNHISSNKKVFIDGYAGSGKSLLAVKEAQIWAEDDKKVFFVCPSKKLANNFKNLELSYQKIKVISFDEITNIDLSLEDILIIDEAQAIIGDPEKLSKLEEVCPNFLTERDSSWRFFGDASRQNLKDFQEDDPWKVYENFQSLMVERDYTKFKLRDNYRNKRNLANKVETICKVTYETIKREGDDEKDFTSTPCEDVNIQKNKFKARLEMCLKNFSPNQITILSPNDENSINDLFPFKGINLNTSEFLFKDDEINFSSVKDFRGLESEVIIAIDFTNNFNDANINNYLYTAMTRALEEFHLFFIPKNI